MQLNYRRQLRGHSRDKRTYRTNSWCFDSQVDADIAADAAEDLACDAGYPANDSTICGGVRLKLEDQEDHSVVSPWVFGGGGS